MVRASVIVLSVLLSCYVQPVPADVRCYDDESGATWKCSYDCCYDEDYCCTGSENVAAAYWYAWVLIVLGVLLCLCSCVGCGTYRYRRQRYHIIHTPPSYTTIVAETPAPMQKSGYQPDYGSWYQAPPPYTTSAHN